MKQLMVCFFALVVFASCNQRRGSGNIITEKRNTGDFSGISVGGAFEVEVKSGPSIEVVVESDDNIIRFIETKVSDGILKIRTKNGTNFNNAHFKVFVTVPEINSMQISGAANVKVKDQLNSHQKISLNVSGAGRLEATVDAPEIYAEVNGAGKIELSGRTRNYKAHVSGSGNLKSANLKSENTEVEASGAGSARVHASVTLRADASGAGNIYYRGGANVQQKTSGAANIKNEN
ncbi:MAG: head GIN domain-containing protein [Ferruginibacter sp.]